MKKARKNAPQSPAEARQQARKRRRRRRMVLQVAITMSVLLVLALIIALIVLHSIGVTAAKKKETTSFLAVKAVEVVGDTRYTDEELIEASGLYVGQSLLALNKVQAHNALLSAFPYLSRVSIANSSFDTVCITVEEATVLGAVELESGWMIVSDTNRALELLPAESLPDGILRIEGATLAAELVGGSLLDERSLSICTTLVEAAATYNLADMTAIDITEKTNVSIWWKDQVQVILGNTSNLTAEIKALTELLPTLIKNNGESVTGRLDMSSHADDDSSNDKAIYTSPELLNTGSTDTSAGDEGNGGEPATNEE